MAFYIDEAGKRGLKAEGKNFFAWDVSRRKISIPVTDAPPKSQMTRCSDFEARMFMFESAKEGWLEIYDKLNDRVPAFSTDLIERIETKDVKVLEKMAAEAEAFRDEMMPLAHSLVEAAKSYGLEFSEMGKGAEDFVESITSNVELMHHLITCLKRGEEIKMRFEES